nr:unnamed protein product [Digitaria exilis]
MSSGEFFHDELSSLFAQRPAPPPGGAGEMTMMAHQQQAPASWFADYLNAGPNGMGTTTDYDLLFRALDLPVPGDDAIKREPLLVVDTGGGGFAAATPTPSGGGTAPVTPNTTSSMSSSSSEAAGGGGGGGGGRGGGFGALEEIEDSLKKEEAEGDGEGEESKELGKGEEDDADKSNKKGLRQGKGVNLG